MESYWNRLTVLAVTALVFVATVKSQRLKAPPAFRYTGSHGFADLPVQSSPEMLVTKEVTFDVNIDGNNVGEIVIGLFGRVAPKATENFAQLASGVNGFGYKGSSFHRVIKDFMIQGGDYELGDGKGESSIYGGLFDDESDGLALKHSGSGFVSMANRGPNTNSCQFFVTMKATPWLDGDHVVFGKVVRGMHVARLISRAPTDDKDRPTTEIVIVNSSVEDVDPYTVTSAAADSIDDGEL